MTEHPNLHAPRYGLLLGETDCYQCRARTPTAAIWVGAFQEFEEGEVLDEGEAGLLKYAQWLDPDAAGLVKMHAPWLRLTPTKMSETTYWANHCQTCGSAQGDHYVFGPDGPYWPQDNAALVQLTFLPGVGVLQANGSVGQSSWMERVEDACRRG